MNDSSPARAASDGGMSNGGIRQALIVQIASDAYRAPGGQTRTELKRVAIVEAALALFLSRGYQGTSIDEIAARAAVSKQTVYKQFADKQQLFHAIILGITSAAEELTAGLAATFEGLSESSELAPAFRDLARRYLRFVMQPQVLAVRRLVIGESVRFPDLVRDYYERGPRQFLLALADWMDQLAQRGLLRIAEPLLAADHFAYLVLGKTLDEATFQGLRKTDAELDHAADEGARVFLAAYG